MNDGLRRQELLIALLKGCLGLVPFGGSLLAEIAGIAVPNKRIEMIEDQLRRQQRESIGAFYGNGSALIELPYVQNQLQLYDIINQQNYDYYSSLVIREALKACDNRLKILELSASLIIEAWTSHGQTAGMLANLLSTQSDLQHLDMKLLSKLQSLCMKSLYDGEVYQIGAIEPIAFMLASSGMSDVHREFLRVMLTNHAWRIADFCRTEQYYGSPNIQLLSFVRHVNDTRRLGTLKANDIARLILLYSTLLPLSNAREKELTWDLLMKAIRSLQKSSEEELARLAIDETRRVHREKG